MASGAASLHCGAGTMYISRTIKMSRFWSGHVFEPWSFIFFGMQVAVVLQISQCYTSGLTHSGLDFRGFSRGEFCAWHASKVRGSFNPPCHKNTKIRAVIFFPTTSRFLRSFNAPRNDFTAEVHLQNPICLFVRELTGLQVSTRIAKLHKLPWWLFWICQGYLFANHWSNKNTSWSLMGDQHATQGLRLNDVNRWREHMTASSSGNGSHLGNFMIDWTLVPIACERYASFHIDVHEWTCVWVLFSFLFCKCEQDATVEHALCACKCTEVKSAIMFWEQKQQWSQPDGVDSGQAFLGISSF